MELKDWLFVVPSILALGGVILNVMLTWRFSRHKTQSEKTWEKRREIYSEMISKLMLLKEIVESRKRVLERGNTNTLGDYMVEQDEKGVSFDVTAEAVKRFFDENSIHVSEEMEQIVEAFWKKFCSTRDPEDRRLGVRGMVDADRQRVLYPATLKAYADIKKQAEKEIRVRSV